MRWFVPEAQRGEGDEEFHALLAAFHQLRGVWSGFHPPGPIRRSDFMLLGCLAEMEQRGQTATVSGLAKFMHQSVPGISQRVSELTAQGYIGREKSSHDRRSASLRLTPAGRALMEQGSAVFLARARTVLDSFGPQNTTQLLRLLEELQEVVETARQQEETEHTC